MSQHVHKDRKLADALVFLVDGTHKCCRWGQNLVDEDENGLFRGQLDALSDDVDELSNRQILGKERLHVLPVKRRKPKGRTEGTKYFFLSIVGMSVRSAFSQMTWEGGQIAGDCDCQCFATYRDTVRILLADAFRFSLALLCEKQRSTLCRQG